MRENPPLVAVLTALEVEHEAVRAKLKSIRTYRTHLGGVYTIGTFASAGRDWTVALTAIGAGNPGAALAAGDAINELKPDMLVFLGIAGGLKDVELGDVAVASKVYGYERGKALANRIIPSPDVASSHSRLVAHFRQVSMSRKWHARLPKASRLKAPAPRAVIAPIAAGEKVVKNQQSQVAKNIRHYFSDAVAVEMEGMGTLAAASYRGYVPAIVIRGISDLLDDKSGEHDKVWQQVASGSAAAMLFEGLSSLDSGWLAGLPERFNAAALDPELSKGVFKRDHGATIEPQRQWSAESIALTITPDPAPKSSTPFTPTAGEYVEWTEVSAGATAHIYRARHVAGDVELGWVMIKAVQPGFESSLKSEVAWASKIESVFSRTYSDLRHLEIRGEQRLCAVSRWIPGDSLAARIRAGTRLDLKDARRLWSSLARVLSEMHASGFVHGDIKPMNIVGGPRDWTLIDFGIAGPAGRMDRLVGTPSFMAPEVFNRQRSSASDTYAMALTVYAALTGVEGQGGDMFGDDVWVAGDQPDAPRLALGSRRIVGEWKRLIKDCLAAQDERPTPSELLKRIAALPT